MTIRKGEAWGRAVDRPDGLRTAHGDAELSAMLSDEPMGDYAVDGGDLHRTVGAPPQAGGTVHRLPIDLLEVVSDRSRHVAVAHVVIRRRWWRGPVVFVCNVEHVGPWKVAPRAHPNDGRFDVVEVDASMSWRDRWEARRRAPTGSHVPHPSISIRTATEWSWSGSQGARLWVDGIDAGACSTVRVTIRPDAGAIHV